MCPQQLGNPTNIFIVCCYKNKVYTEVGAAATCRSGEAVQSLARLFHQNSPTYHSRTLPAYVQRDILFAALCETQQNENV